MGCKSCNKANCSGCSTTCATLPYYASAEVCPEDNCEKIYCPQFSFGVCPCVSWNVPACGGTALLSVPGIIGASIGSYLWHTAYGYFRIVSVDSEKGLIGITNECLTGNADPGTQIAAGTCFLVTVPPVESGQSELFPYVAIDFTAPASGDCIPITVTTINGLSVGDTISIGTGFYSIDSFVSDTVVQICNDGDGILPGTSVIAQDTFGNYQYPIYVTSSCCVSLQTEVDNLIVNIGNNRFGWGGVSTGSANAQLITLSIGPSSLIDGQVFDFIAGYTNTATDPTLQVAGAGGALVMRDSEGNQLFPGDIRAGNEYRAVAYGSAFRIVSLPLSRVVYRNTAQSIVSNTTAQTTVDTIAIPANILYTGRSIKLTMYGTLSNGTGSGESCNIRATLGGTDMGSRVVPALSLAGVSYQYQTIISARSSASQVYSNELLYDMNVVSVVVEEPALIVGNGAINMAVAQNLVLSVDLSAADPLLSVVVESVIVELV